MRWVGSILQGSIPQRSTRTFAACGPFPGLHFPRLDMPPMSPETSLTGIVSNRAGAVITWGRGQRQSQISTQKPPQMTRR